MPLGNMVQDEVLVKHFGLLEKIKASYRDRDKRPGALEEAIQYCEEQIAIAPHAASAFRKHKFFGFPPNHTGFKQLAIIREKQGEYTEAIRLCKEAMRQGWGMHSIDGPKQWKCRIERCEKKLKRTGITPKR